MTLFDLLKEKKERERERERERPTIWFRLKGGINVKFITKSITCNF